MGLVGVMEVVGLVVVVVMVVVMVVVVVLVVMSLLVVVVVMTGDWLVFSPRPPAPHCGQNTAIRGPLGRRPALAKHIVNLVVRPL